MVLQEMGGQIQAALQRMHNATIVDERVFKDCLNEVSRALMAADVNLKLISSMLSNVRRTVDLPARAAGHNLRKIIQSAIFDELSDLLNPGGPPGHAPKKKKTSVVVFVGLQGAGKTTSCTKYAAWHQRRGWHPALVCGDTFRAGAVDQLKQNATKARIPFYGSYTETDPVEIAVTGVAKFRELQHDLIVVDTSGRHKQELSLFEEMVQLVEVVEADLIVYVMDASIGQVAFDQAAAFQRRVAVGAVIVTKMDGHSKGGGAVSAVAATKSPILFLGTGEHFEDFEPFESRAFVRRILGMGDFSGLVDQIKEVAPVQDMAHALKDGNLPLRVWLPMMQNLGPALQGLLPNPTAGKEIQAKIKRYTVMMDSMTVEELSCADPERLMKVQSRTQRVARGSGRYVHEVHAMIDEYTKFKELVLGKMGKKLLKSCGGNHMNLQQLQTMMPAGMLQGIGGVPVLQRMMRSYRL